MSAGLVTIRRAVLTDPGYTRKCSFAADAAIDGGGGRVESDLPQGCARNVLSTQARIIALPLSVRNQLIAKQ